MFAYLSLIGMGIIIISWIVQIVKLANGHKEICSCFAGLQFIGIVLLVIDGFMAGNTLLAGANILSALGALIIVFMVGRGNCCCKDGNYSTRL